MSLKTSQVEGCPSILNTYQNIYGKKKESVHIMTCFSITNIHSKNKKKLKKKNIPHLENWHLIRLLSWEVWQSPNARLYMQYEMLYAEKRNKKTEERKKKKKEKIRETRQRKKSQNFSTIPFQTNKKTQKIITSWVDLALISAPCFKRYPTTSGCLSKQAWWKGVHPF